jgi:hypothetical protein
MSGYRQDLTCSIGATQREKKELSAISDTNNECDAIAEQTSAESERENAVSDGGPAFPHDEFRSNGSHYRVHLGMTLLDYFAGQALSNPAIAHSGLGDDERADVSFRAAMAMLKERERISEK